MLREMPSAIQVRIRWRSAGALAALVLSLTPVLAAPPPGEPPEATLYAPMEDYARPDAVVMSWKAMACGRGVAIRSVSLHWAERPGGAWHTIGDPTKMVKTDRYSWRLADDVPRKVYLRLTVCDMAGRTAVAQTDRAFLLPRPRKMPQ